MIEEVWQDISGYVGLYQVSTFGRIKRFYKHEQPRILKIKCHNGYLYVDLVKECKQKRFLVHRLVALAFIPNPDNKPQVNHRDGNKCNNHVDNLEWATRSENMRHAFNIGLSHSGEDCTYTKLTDERIRYIRENPDNLNTYQLAEKFGVSQQHISNVQRGNRRKTAGGKVRGKKQRGYPRIPDNVREQIRKEYHKGSREHGCIALAKQYGYHPQTIWQIINE